MTGDHGHSDCKCSQNIDFLGQIFNRKNPLEDWIKKEIEKLLPEDIINFINLFNIKYDNTSKKGEIFLNAKDSKENKVIDNDMLVNTKIKNNYSNFATSRNAFQDYTAIQNTTMNVNSGEKMTFNYKCGKYENNLMIGNDKYVMKAVNLQDLIGKEIYVYVKDNGNRNLAESDNSVNNEGNIKLIYRDQEEIAGNPAPINLNSINLKHYGPQSLAQQTEAGIKVGTQLTKAGDLFQDAAKGFFTASTVFDFVDRLDLDSRLSDLKGAVGRAAEVGKAATEMWGTDYKGNIVVKPEAKGAANADQVPDAQVGAILADGKEDGKDHPVAQETFGDRNDEGKKAAAKAIF